MAVSEVPSPWEKFSPVVWLRVSRPLVTDSATSMSPAPESTSVMLIRLPLPEENTRAVSSGEIWAAGRLCTGASLTGSRTTLTVAVATELSVPSQARYWNESAPL